MTRKSISISVVPALAGSLLLFAGCRDQEHHDREVRDQSPPPAAASAEASATAGGEVAVNEAPPPPQAEVVPASPGPDFVWIGGAWAWNGRWVWEGGRWDRGPHAGAAWVPHKYEERSGRKVFVRGGWK